MPGDPLAAPALTLPSPIDFADIVHPLAADAFLAEYWTRRAVLLRREGRTFTEYFDWDAVGSVLNAGRLGLGTIKVSRRDHPVPADQFTIQTAGQPVVDPLAVLALFRDGASVGITGADAYWPPLRRVVDGFHDVLLDAVHTNVYCSPAGTQGFQCHFDLHEVFVLQVAGSKHWRVFDPTEEAPFEPWRIEDVPGDAVPPYIDVTLRPGDVLYVPRGHWHYATARDEASVHVTVGITCRKGTDFLDWLARDLAGTALWRRNVPPLDGGGGGRTTPAFESWSGALRAALAERLDEPDLFERFRRDMLAGVTPRHAVQVPLQVQDDVPVSAVTFVRPPGRRHVLSRTEEGIVVAVAGNELHLEGVDPALVTAILERDSFTAAEIRAACPAVSDDDLRGLLTAFVQRGVLLARAQG